MDQETEERIKKIESLITSISINVLPRLQQKLESLTCDCSQSCATPFIASIQDDQICHLRTLGFKWETIAKLFEISRMTLYRWRKELGITDYTRFSNISDFHLKSLIVSIKTSFPDCGGRIVIGALRSKGYIIPRSRVRAVIHEVDPINTSLQWHPRLLRKPYSFPGPMSFWHIGMLLYSTCILFCCD